ncbi:hypothetical protein scyTo_0001811 [Scyliorhinus torazame]|uniref:Nucleolar protein 6 n=1 Tax=Scyliorhinus torazame TaxID=75743 RepID=A0A401PG27_SCYTO|nr:hypothetical protein [Scyliorhinus torazame]
MILPWVGVVKDLSPLTEVAVLRGCVTAEAPRDFPGNVPHPVIDSEWNVRRGDWQRDGAIENSQGVGRGWAEHTWRGREELLPVEPVIKKHKEKMKRKSDEADLHAAEQQDSEEFQDAGSSSVDDEEEDEEIKKPAKIRSVTKKKQTKGLGVIGAVKLSKRELYKPPTNEELNQLKETENLFHSTLLRMQIEELLKEVKVKERKRKVIETFLHEVKNLLSNIPETEQVDVTDQSWLPKGVKVPFLQIPYNIKGKFHFLRPASVKVIGSYLLGTCAKPEINVDVAVTMPAEILQAKDNLNQRYLRKRALYLAHIACHLSKNKIFGCVKFGYFNSNHLKPILYLSPQGDDVKLVTIRLHPCAPASFFKFSRFHPSKNNVRNGRTRDVQ